MFQCEVKKLNQNEELLEVVEEKSDDNVLIHSEIIQQISTSIKKKDS